MQKAKKILIIDDDFDIRLSLAELLVSEGYKVATARDGAAGLSYLKTEAELPFMVLVDLKMPNVDGLEFRDLKKEIKNISRIPVVFMSVEKPDERVQEDTFLKKPYDLFEVMRTIEKIYQRGASPLL